MPRRRDFWGWEWDGSWGPRGPRRRRHRRSWFGPGDMKYVILRTLRDKPMHGYEVMKALEEDTKGCYTPSPGTVYPTLQWLEDEGLVTSSERDGKKIYEISDEGRKFLEEHKSTVEEIFDRVDEMIDHFVGDPMPDVNRAVGRVVSQVYRASWRHRGNDEKRKKIADILENALNELDALAT